LPWFWILAELIDKGFWILAELIDKAAITRIAATAAAIPAPLRPSWTPTFKGRGEINEYLPRKNEYLPLPVASLQYLRER